MYGGLIQQRYYYNIGGNYTLREMSKVKTTIWGLQSMNNPYKSLYIVKLLF